MKRRYQEANIEPPSSNDSGITNNTRIKTKSRACSECKRHKIKCQVDDGQEQCRRCLRQNLSCVTNNSLQKFVEDDTQWKIAAAAQTSKLEAAMADVLRQLRLPKLETYGSSSQLPITSRPVETAEATRENSREPDLDGGRIVSAPTDALYEVTRIRTLRSDRPSENQHADLLESDLISRAVLPLNTAESLFEFFNYTMNQLLWGGVVMKHKTLESARRSSSLLSTAILTVAALHIPGRSGALEACYEEYITLVEKSTIKRRNTLDDIRALCIGAFWLPDLSWRLSGLAVRLAGEMGLHQSLQRLSSGTGNYERAQLWFLLYVCDHQFSTTYGRPSSISEDSAITGYEKFLSNPTTVPGDVRLMSQVSLFILHSQVFRQLGTDNDMPIAEDDFDHLRHFNIELDQWRNLWAPRCSNNQYVHSYPSKGATLHYYFAKFQFNSLALRGISPNNAAYLSTSRKESANLAISSAMSTLAFILDEPDIRNNIIGVPLFAHTMLAFSAVFLLKVTLKWNLSNITDQSFSSSSSASRTAGLYINSAAVEDLVDRVITLLQSAVSSEKHLTKRIAGGLSKMLASFRISLRVSRNALEQNGQNRDVVAPRLQGDYESMSTHPHESSSSTGLLAVAEGSLPDDFGFSFDEAWQDFPATTLDFLTSQWQDSAGF